MIHFEIGMNQWRKEMEEGKNVHNGGYFLSKNVMADGPLTLRSNAV